jgi:hypothetical protein
MLGADENVGVGDDRVRGMGMVVVVRWRWTDDGSCLMLDKIPSMRCVRVRVAPPDGGDDDHPSRSPRMSGTSAYGSRGRIAKPDL